MTKATKLFPKKSKKYNSNAVILAELDNPNVEQAIEQILKTDAKDSTVEVHFNLNIEPTKADQLVRSSVVLPHGTGKEVKVAAFVSPENEKTAKAAGADIIGDESVIAEILKTGKADFDAAVAEPAMMKELAKVARVLGTQGLMPSPKNGTVGTDVEKMIKEIKAGKLDIKNDKTGNLHVVAGKVNEAFDKDKLVENVNAVIEAVKSAKPEGVKKKYIERITLCTTFGPSIKLSV